ncbi:hypothetical protein A1O1_02956 [Capronia coronata CBS 617.96]|uniref:Uncharacterized protein n=1 Tax=Capronia coronata CBS 617.96 TaxID=1182541 RepID=W9YXZ7_9EURO|nr:uncharacterized protein A1O1_02956 [Capronia coronata CBS 617.96]EXJ94560.1 hypothetical protein A1O1_02956 [Capronia coronata CBS 617.96]
MKLEDIQLTLDGGECIPEIVSALVTLKYEKGEKKSRDHRTRRVESFKEPSLKTVDLVLILLAHGLRYGLFKDGATLDKILTAAKARGDRTLRWKHPEYPFIPTMTRPRAGIWILSSPASYEQIWSTIRNMGAAKDLVRLQKDIITIADGGASRALGHGDPRSTRCYNGQEDEALGKHKTKLPTTAIDKRIVQSGNAYRKLTRPDIKLSINGYLIQNSDDVYKVLPPSCLRTFPTGTVPPAYHGFMGTTRPLSFFLSPKPGKENDGNHEWKAVRVRYAVSALRQHRQQWEKTQNGPKDQQSDIYKRFKGKDWVPSTRLLSSSTTRPSSSIQLNDDNSNLDLDGDTLIPDVLDPALFEPFDPDVDDEDEKSCELWDTLESANIKESATSTLAHDEQGEDLTMQSLEMLLTDLQHYLAAMEKEEVDPLNLSPVEFVHYFSRYNIVVNNRIKGGKSAPLENFKGRVE